MKTPTAMTPERKAQLTNHRYRQEMSIGEAWNAIDELLEALDTVESAAAEAGRESFHPLHDAHVLTCPGSQLGNYVVGDKRSRTLYVSQRLLHVVLLTYIKHWKSEDVIGWDALGDELHSAICEAIGDDEFVKWNDTTSQA
jgi:hypothetical protein